MDHVAIPGARDVRGVLDGSRAAETAVVACPPHPRMGGSRADQRLQAVSDALVELDIACLRFDYGSWDESRGERTDIENALAWARDHFDTVALFGYSFGAGVALLAAADIDPRPAAVSVLAPPARLDDGSETCPAVDAIDCPLQVVYGERDDTVDWEPVVDCAREAGATVEGLSADHHLVGQGSNIGTIVGDFLAATLRRDSQ